MSLRAVSGYECLAHEKSDPAITPDLSNQLINQSQTGRGERLTNQTTTGTFAAEDGASTTAQIHARIAAQAIQRLRLV